MSNALDMSLDDLIGKSKSTGAHSSSFRGRRRGALSGSGPARRLSNRAPARASPYPNHLRQLFSQGLAVEPYAVDTGAKLYISNLDYGVSNEDIKVLFSEVGNLKQHSIHYDRSGRSKGTAEVEYLRRSDAVVAIKRYNNVQLDGKEMKIELVGVNLVTAPVLPPPSKGILGNPKGMYRSMQGGNTRGPPHGNSHSRFGRGRGQGRNQGEKKSAKDLDAELEKYHFEAMKIS